MRKKSTFVTIFFIVAVLLVTLVLDFAFSDLFALLRIDDTGILGESFTLSTFSAFAVSLLAAFIIVFVDKRGLRFVEECVVEFDKVAFPSWTEVRKATVTVIYMCCLAAVILGCFDAVFGFLTSTAFLMGT